MKLSQLLEDDEALNTIAANILETLKDEGVIRSTDELDESVAEVHIKESVRAGLEQVQEEMSYEN
jgi:urease gamma subunit